MFRIVALVIAIALGPCLPAAGAGIVTFGLTAKSPALGHPIPYAVYRPFPAPPSRERWPVVYLLHGVGGEAGDWFTWGNLGPILDQAMAEGRVPPMIVVAPGFADSWYEDSPDPGGFGLVETALATDLVAAIDKSLPTARCREGRAIGGLSMGGWGAMLEGLDHPDVFGAVMSFSGALHQPLIKGDSRLAWMPQFFFHVFGSPFDMDRFNAGNPFNHIPELQKAEHKPAFYLTIGDADSADLIEASALFHDRLRERNADTTLRIGPGGHYWDTWQRSIVPALEWLAPRLDPTCGKG
jgi:enterochelin esterase family protein